METTRARVLARTAGWALTLAAAGLFLPGCNRDDQVADAISEANRDLAVVSPGATASPTPELDAKTYSAVLTKLKSVAGKGGDGQQAAVDLLIARAQLGLAGQTAAGAADLEQAAMRKAADVRSALQQYLAYSGQAAALSFYDPAPLLADLDKQITEREADLAKARKAKQDIDARIAALRSQARAKMDQAAAEHNIEAGLREQAIRVSNTEAAQLIAQANQHRRVADAFDVESSMLDAQAAQIAPQSPEAQLLIDQLTNQRDQLGKGSAEIKKRDTDNRKLAAAARGDQATAASAVDAAIKALATAREGDLPKHYDDAVRQYGEAAGSATKAVKASRSQAQLAVAEARQALGDLYWSRAQRIAATAAILETLAAANPALPQQAEYAQQASAARADQKLALDAATEAYQAAKTAYESAGLKGDAVTRVEEVGKGLTGIILKTSGGAVDLRDGATPSDPAAPTEPAPEPAPDAGPTAAADSPRSTVEAIQAAANAGRYEEVASYIYMPAGPAKDLMTSAMGMLNKIKQLDDACEAKIGQRLSDDPTSLAAQVKKNSVGIKDAGGQDIDPAALTYTVTGDTATATGPDLPEPAKFRRVDGRWLIDGTGLNDANMQAAKAVIPLMSQAIDGVLADVQAGKFKTLGEVNMALMARIGPGGG